MGKFRESVLTFIFAFFKCLIVTSAFNEIVYQKLAIDRYRMRLNEGDDGDISKISNYDEIAFSELNRNYGPFGSFKIYPNHRRGNVMMVRLQSLNSTAKRDYISNDHKIIKRLNKNLPVKLGNREPHEEGIIRYNYFSPNMSVLQPTENKVESHFGEYKAIFTQQPKMYLSERSAKELFKDPEYDLNLIEREFRLLTSGLISAVGKITANGILGNCVHPTKMGIHRFNTNRALSTPYVYYTDMSIGSILSEPEAEPFYKVLRKDLHLYDGIFPLFWYEEIFETWDLPSLKGHDRAAVNEKIATVYTVLRLVDELPFYISHTKVLMNSEEFKDKKLATHEMIRTHLTLAEDELKGVFDEVFLYYMNNAAFYWTALNMKRLVACFDELFFSLKGLEFRAAGEKLLRRKSAQWVPTLKRPRED